MRVRGEVGRSGMPSGQAKGSSHLGTDCLPGGHAGPSYHDDAFLVGFGSVGLLPKIFAGSWVLRQMPSKPEAHRYLSAGICIVKLISQDLWLYSFNLNHGRTQWTILTFKSLYLSGKNS